MELLIPGLILVALMVWASTKIKKHAADAFEAEDIETANYSLPKPDGFLHVLGDRDHEFYAYSKEFGDGSNAKVRRATIEIDLFPGSDLAQVRDAIKTSATVTRERMDAKNICELEAGETANEIDLKGFYKIVAAGDEVYRLRFAVLPEHSDDYLRKMEETLDGFIVRTN